MVITRTGTEVDANTDADNYYTIVGTKGKTAEHFADHSDQDDRELGQIDTYTITDDTDVGEFRCVSIRHTCVSIRHTHKDGSLQRRDVICTTTSVIST